MKLITQLALTKPTPIATRFGALMILTAFALALFPGCSSRPSASEIKAAVTAELQHGVPVSWVGNLIGGDNPKLTTVEVKEWGSINSKHMDRPTTIRVVGSAGLRDPFNLGKVVSFDKTGEFWLYKDDSGRWKASLQRGIFQ